MISIIIPVFNENESLKELYSILTGQLKKQQYELIFIDDGSTDGSAETLKLFEKDKKVKVITFRKNLGKSLALNIGFEEARGEIIITMDSDLQDLPEEIPNFLAKIKEGHDVVVGWKKLRHDPLEKRLPSKIFNKLVSAMTGVKLHDFNCGFKAYTREVIKSIKIYGELHRFTPVLASEYGFSVTEIPVQHGKRLHGKSKFGMERYLRGFFDICSVYFLFRYSRRPMHFIGSAFLSCFTAGCLLLIYCFYKQFVLMKPGVRAALIVAIFLMLTAAQILLSGLLAEFFNYHFQNGRLDVNQYLKKSGKNRTGD
ncbi:MAG TPA: glycosyltransferase [Spirochaetia bacterium]|nr:glycosyltransferase [Spirochaetia bacterium]